MSPEERQMLTDLFERVRSQANAPRDRDAETLIAQAVQAQPYAPYLLSQAVIVQEHALKAAEQKILDLQSQVSQLQTQAAPQPSSGGSFLGGLFGGGAPAPRPAPQPQQQPSPSQPNPWGTAQAQPQYAPPQAAPSPWGAPAAPQGGGFLKGALGAAAGVAGGVLLADSIRGLMAGGHGGGLFGGGMGGGGLGGGGETVVNNYYESPQDGESQDADYQTAADDDDMGGGGDDYSDDV